MLGVNSSYLHEDLENKVIKTIESDYSNELPGSYKKLRVESSMGKRA